MQIKIYKNRIISEDGSFVGYLNENHAEKLIFDIPEELSNYEKVICFSSQKGNFEDILQGNEYVLTNSITNNRVVDMYLKFIKKLENDKVEVIKTSIMSLDFKDSFETSEEIDEEKVDILDTLILETKEASGRANAISEDLENKVATDYYKGEKGDSYIITEEDYTKIEEDVKTDIAPTINEIKEISEHAETIARGRATGYVFDTVNDLDIWLQNSENVSKLVLGDNFYIRATNVPDFWWDGNQKQRLEAEKPDLSNLVDKSAFVYDAETETLSITI